IEKLDGENVFIFSIDRFSRPLILMGLPRRLAMFQRRRESRTSSGWVKGKRGGEPGKKRDRRGRKQRTGHRFQAGRPPHWSNHVAAPTEEIVPHTTYIFYLKFLSRVVYKNPLNVDLQFIYIKLDMTYFNDFAKWKFRGWRLSQMLEKTFSKPSGTKSTPIKYTSG
ncbi:hypothetical protein ALC57_11628, partial [Trachymyrmex cornetzi]